jgi:hypothetical protein
VLILLFKSCIETDIVKTTVLFEVSGDTGGEVIDFVRNPAHPGQSIA